MLTHIHPSLLWFTCEYRPKFNGIVHAGSASSTIQGPPRAQSPFARSRRYLNRRDDTSITSEGVTPPSSLLRAHAPDQNPPTHFELPYRAGSLQVVASPCWEMVLPDVISAILAQVPGPLPRDASLVPLSVSSQRVTASPSLHKVRHIQNSRRNATSTTTPFSERQSFRYVQAPMLASPPGCTYRTESKSCGQPGRLRHAMDWRLPSRTVVSLHDRIGQLSWRDFHPLDCSLVGRYLQRWGVTF